MLKIEPGNATLGAQITGVDLSRPLTDANFACVLRALGQFGVYRLMKRCQVLADKVFDPGFLDPLRGEHGSA
jgi:hypothetical protein